MIGRRQVKLERGVNSALLAGNAVKILVYVLRITFSKHMPFGLLDYWYVI